MLLPMLTFHFDRLVGTNDAIPERHPILYSSMATDHTSLQCASEREGGGERGDRERKGGDKEK